MATVKIAGNTYNCRDLIKSSGGKFDASTKTWAIEENEWEILSKLDCGRATRGCYIVGKQMAAPVKSFKSSFGGVCKKCGSYCYGDCEA